MAMLARRDRLTGLPARSGRFRALGPPYYGSQEKDPRRHSLASKDVSIDFHQAAQQVGSRKFVKGAFPALLDGEPASEDEGIPEKLPYLANNNKRPNTSGARTGEKGCKACDAPSHTLEGCWYILPHLAFKTWKRNGWRKRWQRH